MGCGQNVKDRHEDSPNPDTRQETSTSFDDNFVLIPIDDNKDLPFSTIISKRDFAIGEHFIQNGELVGSDKISKRGVLCVVSAMKDSKAGESSQVTAVIDAGDDFGTGNVGVYFSNLSRDQRKVLVDNCVSFGSNSFSLHDLRTGLGDFFEIK